MNLPHTLVEHSPMTTEVDGSVELGVKLGDARNQRHNDAESLLNQHGTGPVSHCMQTVSSEPRQNWSCESLHADTQNEM